MKKLIILVLTLAMCFCYVSCNLFTKEDAKDPAEQNDPADMFGFHYTIKDGAEFKRDGRITLDAYVTNVSDTEYVYTGTGQTFRPDVRIWCVDKNGEEYEIPKSHSEFIFTTDVPIERYAAPRESGINYINRLIPTDAPAGTYSITLSYLGVSVTFNNVFVLN